MLCASDNSVCAQDAAYDLPSHSATQTTLIHDPYDPRIDTEYQTLVQRWTHQLFQRSREFVSSLENTGTTATNDDTKVPYTTPPFTAAFTEDILTSEHQQWLANMDRFLEELWIDAQNMLQCSQAWNYSLPLACPSSSTDILSAEEAVRSMNIFGLRIMQRTLYARQTLLKRHCHRQPVSSSVVPTATASPLMAPWISPSEAAVAATAMRTSRGVQETHEDDKNDVTKTGPQTSLNLSLMGEEGEVEQEMNAPLLRKTFNQRLDSSCSCTISSSCCDDPSCRSVKDVLQETTTTSSPAGQLRYPSLHRPASRFPATSGGGGGPSPVMTRRREFVPSTAAPQLLSRSASACRPVSPSCGHYQRQCNDVLSVTSRSGVGNIDEDGLWKSWFGSNDMMDNHNDRHSMCTRTTSNSATSCYYDCCSHVPKKCLPTGEAEGLVETEQYILNGNGDESTTSHHRSATIVPFLPMDEKAEIESPIEEAYRHCLHVSGSTNDMMVTAPPSVLSPLKKVRSYGFTNAIVRCESNILAFRPIIKNFATRCPRDSPLAKDGASLPLPLVPQSQTITKSKSFPSKAASMSSSSPTKEFFSSAALVPVPSKTLPHPINNDNKERNFVMRSIISKKASLGNLFSAKK